MLAETTLHAEKFVLQDTPITIRFVDITTNNPIPHFRFRWLEGTPRPPLAPGPNTDQWREAVSDANGTYRTRYTGDQMFTVESLMPHFTTEHDPQYCIFTLRDSVDTFTVRVGPPCTVNGRVFDSATGKGFPDISIELQKTRSDRKYEALTNAKGEYEFPLLAPGSYIVKWKRPLGYIDAFLDGGLQYLEAKTGHAIAHADLPLERESDSLSKRTKRRFKLNSQPEPVGPPLTIRGVLFDRDGSLAANAKIAITSAKQTQPATTNARGEFTLENLPPGTHKLEIIHQDRAYRYHWLDTGSSRIALVLQHQGPLVPIPPRPIAPDSYPVYSFRVFVLDAASGAPIQHYSCSWAPPTEARRWNSQFGASDEVFSADGSHVVSRTLSYTPVLISVSARGYATESELLTGQLRDHEIHAPSVIVRLSPTAIIDGRVVDPNGMAVGNARIVASALPGLELLEPAKMQMPIAATDANGNFTITSLPLVPLTLTAFDDRWGRITTPVTPISGEKQEVTLQFVPSTPLNIALRSGNARQTDATAVLSFDDPRAQAEYGGEYTTDIDGRIKIPHALPSTGTAQARIHRENSGFTRARTIPFNAPLNSPTDLQFDFPPGCAALMGAIKVPDESILNVTVHLHYETTGEIITTDPIDGSWIVLNNLPAGRPAIAATIRTNKGLHIRTLTAKLRPGLLTRIDIR